MTLTCVVYTSLKYACNAIAYIYMFEFVDWLVIGKETDDLQLCRDSQSEIRNGNSETVVTIVSAPVLQSSAATNDAILLVSL